MIGDPTTEVASSSAREGHTYEGISVVIPAYRSPGTLDALCDEIDEHLGPLADQIEVILVDDGSGDGTWSTIERLARERPAVRGMTLLRNYGQHNALLAGLRAARLPIVVTIDDDLQNPPSEIPRLLEALTPDIDLVYGRAATERQSLPRNLASKWIKRSMATALGPDVYPRSTAFRAFRRELIQASDQVSDPYISIDVLLTWGTSRITDVVVDHQARAAGQSGYTLGRLVRHAMNMITGYSIRPLRWVSAVGMTAATLGFLLLVYVVGRRLLVGGSVQGFTFLAAAITLFSGVQLVSLGVIGEYIGRMHFRTMGRPPYSIRTTSGFGADRHDDALDDATLPR